MFKTLLLFVRTWFGGLGLLRQLATIAAVTFVAAGSLLGGLWLRDNSVWNRCVADIELKSLKAQLAAEKAESSKLKASLAYQQREAAADSETIDSLIEAKVKLQGELRAYNRGQPKIVIPEAAIEAFNK